MKTNFAFIFFVAVFGFCCGQLSTEERSSTDFASNAVAVNSPSITVETLYPCPTATEYQSLLSAIHFQGAAPYSCAKGAPSMLGRVLKFLSKAKATNRESWPGAADALEDSLAYLVGQTRTTLIDLSQITSIARNRDHGQIELGGLFFKSDPLSSTMTMLHEARHSDPQAQGHVRCRWGDIPGSDAGCDQKFVTDSTAGAYNYEVLIALGWSKYLPGLNKGQREYLVSDAFWRLNARFNEIPSALAVPLEGIYVLDEAGKILRVNMITARLEPVESPLTYARIEYNSYDNGLLAYSGGLVYSLTPLGNGGKEPRKDPVMHQPLQLRDAKMMNYTEANSQQASYYFVTPKNELKHFDVNPKTGVYFLNASSVQPTPSQQLMRIVQASGFRYALTSTHQLVYRGDTAWVNSNFVSPGGWLKIDGGLFHSFIYGLDQSGRLFYWDADKKINTDASYYDGAAIKSQESASFRAALLPGNRVLIKYYADRKVVTLQLNHPTRLKDMAVARRSYFNPSVTRQQLNQSAADEAVKTCRLTKVFDTLWLHDPIGIDGNARLVQMNPTTKVCAAVAFNRYDVTNEDIADLVLSGSENDSARLSYPTIVFKKKDGSEQTLRPYDFVR